VYRRPAPGPPAGIDSPRTDIDATFTLDALGHHRTRVLSAGGTDTYSHLGTGEQVVRIANSGGTTTDSIVDPAANRQGVKQAGTVNWLVPDLGGSVAGSLDATATGLTGALRYDGYGQTVDNDQPGSVGAGVWSMTSFTSRRSAPAPTAGMRRHRSRNHIDASRATVEPRRSPRR
jgi:hypothetical protein